MILYAEVECVFYEGNSLKEKRSILKKIISRLKRDFNIAIAELDYQNLWRRTKLGIVTISNQLDNAEQIIQKVLQCIDSYSQLERTITHIERL